LIAEGGVGMVIDIGRAVGWLCGTWMLGWKARGRCGFCPRHCAREWIVRYCSLRPRPFTTLRLGILTLDKAVVDEVSVDVAFTLQGLQLEERAPLANVKDMYWLAPCCQPFLVKSKLRFPRVKACKYYQKAGGSVSHDLKCWQRFIS
jgi:hypothetical protein